MEKRKKTVEAGEVVQALREVAFGEASDESGAKVKLASKLRALELLGKHLGMFDGTGGADKEPVRIVEIGEDESGKCRGRVFVPELTVDS